VTGAWSFAYDTLNRVLTAQTPSTWGVSFTNGGNGAAGIDAWGNLIQTSSVSGTNSLAMSVNQQVNANNQFTMNGYAYDAAGNVLDDGPNNGCVTNSQPTTYAWNAEDQMTCAAGVTYTYDGDGERVEKSSGTMYWGGGPGDALAESDLSGNLTSEYIFFNGKRIARRDVSGAVYYYFSDHLGSSNVVTNSAGVIQNESDYYPYGGESQIANALPSQHYKFTDKERDSESGNDYFGARYYNSAMGRFMSPDWSAKVEPVPYSKLDDPQSLNLYAYVLNHPLSLVDADGHVPGPDRFGCSEGQKDCNTAQQKAKQPISKDTLITVLYHALGNLTPDPNAKPGAAGSAEDLSNARVATAEVILTKYSNHTAKPGTTVESDKFTSAEKKLSKMVIRLQLKRFA